jgi:hypothetical protein
MLEPLPSRSVTRFLLPLADVMTLLFAIFLLLPHLEQQPGVQAGEAASPGSLWTAVEQRQAREELVRLRRLSELPASQRLQWVVLHIDNRTGGLVLQDAGRELVLNGQPEVQAMVERHLAAARAGNKELVYVLQLPRTGVGFLTYPDLLAYRKWFQDLKVNYDIPGLPADLLRSLPSREGSQP